MKYTSVLCSTALLILSIVGGVANGAPLTEQQLLKMKAAGISQDLIVQQIRSDGIAFAVDPDVMIALKKAGFSDTVLGALLKAQTGPVAASPTQSGARMEQPPAQAQVDPCVSWQQEEDRLEKESKAITEACLQLGKPRTGDYFFVDHCTAMNCSVEKRYIEHPDPNHCDQYSHIVSEDLCKDVKDYDPGPFVKFNPVQVIGPNDSKYSCAQLKVVAWELADNVAQMDKSIQKITGQAQTHSQMAQVAGVMAPSATAAAAGMQMMSSSDTQKAAGIQQIRDSQQKRHDYLMQIYFQKQCDD